MYESSVNTKTGFANHLFTAIIQVYNGKSMASVDLNLKLIIIIKINYLLIFECNKHLVWKVSGKTLWLRKSDRNQQSQNWKTKI